jgi:hypothetical protein
MKKKYDLIFLSIGKNIENYISLYFQFLKQLNIKTSFRILSIIGENDSKDKTLYLIKEELKKSKYDFVHLNLLFLKNIRDRVERISLGRQYLLQFIKKKKIASKYIVVVDIDDVLPNKINLNKFKIILKMLNDNRLKLFGISVKSNPIYYDLYPLLIKDYYEYPISEFSKLNRNPLKYYLLRKKKVIDFQKRITLMNDIKTISSHNGMTVYLYKDYIKSSYIRTKNSKISEHLSFNSKLHHLTKKHILMTNEIKFKAPSEHINENPFSLLFNFIKKKFY